MKKTNLSIALALAGTLALPAATQAATEAQKQAAIDSALLWLAGQQQADGRWNSNAGQTGDVAATGASLLSYLEEGHSPTSGTAYSTQVANGLNFIFDNAAYVPISDQPAGNPDGGGMVGQGLRLGGNDNNQIYSTGLTLPAVVLAGLEAGLDTAIVRPGSAVDGQTYRNVIQDAVDYLSWAQADTGTARGGWRYLPNTDADNSVSQWPALASIYAASAGIDTPQFVKDEQRFWIDYSQNDINGGGGYTDPSSTTPLRTGSLMVQMTAAGLGTGSSQVQNALDYINNNWQTTCSPTCTFGDYYGMWAIYKGLESTIGLDDTTSITNLYPQGDAELDPGDTWNWWENFSEFLVDSQNADGSWTGGTWGSIQMRTAWAVNILQAVEIPGPEPEPKAVPEPSSALGLGIFSLLGAGAALKRQLQQKSEE